MKGKLLRILAVTKEFKLKKKFFFSAHSFGQKSFVISSQQELCDLSGKGFSGLCLNRPRMKLQNLSLQFWYSLEDLNLVTMSWVNWYHISEVNSKINSRIWTQTIMPKFQLLVKQVLEANFNFFWKSWRKKATMHKIWCPAQYFWGVTVANPGKIFEGFFSKMKGKRKK